MGLTERIIEVRERKGFSQSQVAEELNMERQNYSRIEKRGKKMSIEQLEAIADAIFSDLVELLEIVDPIDTDERVKQMSSKIIGLNREIEFLKGIIKEQSSFIKLLKQKSS